MPAGLSPVGVFFIIFLLFNYTKLILLCIKNAWEHIMTDYDVIVIGAGPAGSTVAKIAANAGYRVLMLEKKHPATRRVPDM